VKANRIAQEVCASGDVTPDAIRDCTSVDPDLAERAADAWAEDDDKRDAMVALQGMGLTTSQAQKSYKAWESSAPRKVQENPYCLARLDQIGFATADGVARGMGIDHDADIRLRAGAEYCCKEARQDGHVGLPRKALEAACADTLNVPREKSREPIDWMIKAGRLVEEHGLICRSADASDEQTVADELARLGRQDATMTENELVAWLDAHDYSLTDQQREAFVATLGDAGLVTLTGGPGTGKTYTLQAICDAWDEYGDQMHLASPTGRAAKRITEVTGYHAQTIHRLLAFRPGQGFTADVDSIDGLVVIDETSMLDTMLAARLFEAIDPSATVLLVGDPDQLPSVGPGYVLQDILDGPAGHAAHLTKIHRQAEGSGIVKTAYQVNDGTPPSLTDQHDDFGVVEVTGSRQAAKAVDAVANRMEEKGYDLTTDVQFLAPMYNGEAGVDAINSRLQKKVHAAGMSSARNLGGTNFVQGDRVMQTRNNYELGVTNGDVGRIRHVYPKTANVDKALDVQVDGAGVVEYTAYEAASELNLAYACTIHKSQGSEYPVAVVVLTASHWIMCERTLLYTALTRAAEFGVLIAELKALRRACENNSPVDRHRALTQRLENLI